MSAAADLALPRVKLNEGYRALPYTDSQGVLTIGYGCALDVGWPEPFAAAVAKLELESAERDAQTIAGYDALDPLRRSVLIEMAFNLGMPHLLGFKKFLAAISKLDFKTAAAEMRDSQWAKQVGARAQRLARIIETGTDQ